jgi:predicted ribosome quality control (RQC) complex YloA/Tae2 family protein
MSLTLSEFTAITKELRPLVSGGIIQKIYQPSPATITLEIRNPGNSYTLLASCESQMARFHILTHPLSNPQTPPNFCQFLRSTIQGGRIEKFEQIPGDRILKISIQAQKPYCLIVSLTGRHSDILLTNEDSTILRTIKSEQKNVGTIFSPPSLKFSSAAPSQEQVVTQLKAPQAQHPFPLSLHFEESYNSKRRELEAEHAHQQRLSVLRKDIKKTQRLLQSLSQELERASRFREYGRYGELLKSHLSHIRPGQTDITVKDYYDNTLPELQLLLDPTKDGPGNLQNYFRKYRKYTGAQREVLPRIEHTQLHLQDLEIQLAVLQEEKPSIAPTSAPLPPSHSRRSQKAKTSPTLPSRKKTPLPSLPYRKFLAEDGMAILVGKHAQGNDHVTFKVAKSQDLWLHARGTPGSHVVIQLGKQETPSHDTLKDALTLALFYSDLRKSGKGEVVYTYKKHVRKVKGQKAGSVLITQDRSKWLEIDQNRLERLKHSSSS